MLISGGTEAACSQYLRKHLPFLENKKSMSVDTCFIYFFPLSIYFLFLNNTT